MKIKKDLNYIKMKVEIVILISVILSSISAVDEAVNNSQTITMCKVIPQLIKFTLIQWENSWVEPAIVLKPPVIILINYVVIIFDINRFWRFISLCFFYFSSIRSLTRCFLIKIERRWWLQVLSCWWGAKLYIWPASTDEWARLSCTG